MRDSSPGGRKVKPGKFRAARIAVSTVSATAIRIDGGTSESWRVVMEKTDVDSSTISIQGEKDRASSAACGE
jgi:hypothetical protein